MLPSESTPALSANALTNCFIAMGASHKSSNNFLLLHMFLHLAPGAKGIVATASIRGIRGGGRGKGIRERAEGDDMMWKGVHGGLGEE